MMTESRQVEVEITAKVKTTLTIYNDETLEDLQSRDVDIYLHGAGPDGYINKQDLGASEHSIKVINTDDTTKVVTKNGVWILNKQLPPVGTVCEYWWSKDSWYKVEIIMHDNGYAIFRFSDASFAKHQSSCTPENFRPCRTAKEQAIQEMSKVFHDASNGAIDDAAFGALYDAGFIKKV